ncbi:MAG TPA: transglycosylase SLT domain-containing protein [Bryobacteraceae bacterium]|nr:transglycosylase SLT domain-containing protein [Bryobacteraceae bacterium]
MTPDPPPLEPRAPLAPDAAHGVTTSQVNLQNRVDSLLREADWHFQLGRRHYQEGDIAGARREFDRAIDALLTAPEMSSTGQHGAIERKLESLVEAIYRLDLAGLGSGDTGEPAYERAALDDIPQMTFPVDPRLKNKVLEEVRATASQLPLQVTDAVLSYIKYFSSERGRKSLLFGLRRAGRYKSLIHRILDEEGVPQELIYLAQAESAFLPRAVSRKQAAGMWQFVAARGRQYGLMQTPLTDERLDFEKATRAAARHLRDLYQQYGDWYLALCAYNAGPGVVDRAVERTGYADFWEFKRRNVLPRETSNYVPIIVAMTIMVKNAREYDLENVELDPPISYDTVDLEAPTNLSLLADLAECPVSQLRELNPALLRNIAPGGMLRIPKGSGTQMAVLNTIPQERRLAWRVHRVGEGDSLSSIAQRYGVNQGSLAALNTSITGEPAAGELLIVPVAQQLERVSVNRTRHASSRTRTAAKSRIGKKAQSARTASTKTLPTRAVAKNTTTRSRAQSRRAAQRKVTYASDLKPRAKSVKR